MNKNSMKKVLFLFCFIGFISITSSFGQGFYSTPYKDRNSGSFSKDASLLSFQYGIGHLSAWNFGYGGGVTLGPVYVKYEKGIMDELGIAAYVAPSFTRYKHYDNVLSFGTGALAYYHFNKLIPLADLDISAGAGLGLKFHNNANYDTKVRGGMIFKVNARYYFSNSFGVHLETGWDYMSALQAGITLRF